MMTLKELLNTIYDETKITLQYDFVEVTYDSVGEVELYRERELDRIVCEVSAIGRRAIYVELY